MVDLGRHRPVAPPARYGLPPLERYAHLAFGPEERPVGYVEASHGCLHRCRHCPIPVVYDGRIRIVPDDVVLADIEAMVAGGARHITFGDPDFLNGPLHSRRVVAAMHDRFPELTFDCTTKVEHILRHADLWPEMAAAGCLFVVSAFETVNDETLALLDKGHTTADAAAAVALLRRHGIEIRPSFLPFTPWTSLDDVADLVDFVAALDLVPNVDPVQYAIRLLVPQGSLLEPIMAEQGRLGSYDAERLTWSWAAQDPAVDRPAWPPSSRGPRPPASRSAGSTGGSGPPSTPPPGATRPATPSTSRPSSAPAKGGHGSPSRGSVERSPPRASSALSRTCRKTGPYGTGAPQIGNHRVRSASSGTSPVSAPCSCSSRWLSRFSPPPGAGTKG